MRSLVAGTQALATASRFARCHAVELARVGRYAVARPSLSPIRFVVFGRGRSGSTTLMSLLGVLPGVHCDDEILNQIVPFPRAYVRACCARSGSQVYGCKILSYQVRRVQRLRRRTEFVRELSADGFRIIYLSRENPVEHVISNIRAREFGFHRAAGVGGQSGKIVIDPQKLLARIEKRETIDRFEEESLADVPHLALTYERNLAFDELHRPTVLQVADFLGLPTGSMSPPKSAYSKMSPRALIDSVENYSELVEALADTPYARYLS